MSLYTEPGDLIIDFGDPNTFDLNEGFMTARLGDFTDEDITFDHGATSRTNLIALNEPYVTSMSVNVINKYDSLNEFAWGKGYCYVGTPMGQYEFTGVDEATAEAGMQTAEGTYFYSVYASDTSPFEDGWSGTYRNIIDWICQSSCCVINASGSVADIHYPAVVCMDKYGNVGIRMLSYSAENNTYISADQIENESFAYESFMTSPPASISITFTDNTTRTYYNTTGDGSGREEFSGNPFFTSADEITVVRYNGMTWLDSQFGRAKNYHPGSFTVIGDSNFNFMESAVFVYPSDDTALIVDQYGRAMTDADGNIYTIGKRKFWFPTFNRTSVWNGYMTTTYEIPGDRVRGE